MKTIVLMGVSCLMLAGVYGVMNKESAVSRVLSFSQASGSASPIDTGDKDKTNNGSTTDTEHKASASKTLDDSHWIDDPLFEKAAGSSLITDNEVELPQEKSNPETIKQAEPKPEAKQLILDLDADSTAQKVPVESI
jgi:hypothetical protein